jgi:molecular chaperone DnaK (HSP70)
MVEIVGLDFGTTNSLVARVVGEKPIVLTDSTNDLPHPSVVWYHGGEVVVGREAKAQLATPALGIVGDIIRSPKAFLGRGEALVVGGVARSTSDVVAAILAYLKADAAAQGHDFDRAYVTVPVTMDGRGRRELRDAGLKAGIRIVQPIHEPLAAIYGYLRGHDDYLRRIQELQDQLILVFDWGGGTLDLTLCQLGGETLTQVANLGDPNVGGDRFDERLRDLVRERHATAHGLTILNIEPNAEKALIQQCESTKITLSARPSSTVFVQNFIRSDGPERTLEVVVTRDDLERITADLVEAGIAAIHQILERVNRQPEGVALCVATGGMVQMPRIRERLLELFGPLRVPQIERGDQLIAEGAAWIAHDRARLRLAKPVELLHADESYITVIPPDSVLPIENGVDRWPLDLYCVDPRDGYAKFHFVRPKWPKRFQSADERLPYANLLIGVDPNAPPLAERLNMEITIDHDLVAGIHATSSLLRSSDSVEVHDLEFGIELGGNGASVDG